MSAPSRTLLGGLGAAVLVGAVAFASSGCQTCCGVGSRPAQSRPSEVRGQDPCDLLAGTVYRNAHGDELRFEGNTVTWDHHARGNDADRLPPSQVEGHVLERFDYRCEGSMVTFRDGDLQSEASLRSGRTLLWNRETWHVHRRDPASRTHEL